MPRGLYTDCVVQSNEAAQGLAAFSLNGIGFTHRPEDLSEGGTARVPLLFFLVSALPPEAQRPKRRGWTRPKFRCGGCSMH
jgi:hypothetical protein